ncbi:hypothetical protein ESCO_003831 [Escovopsis weberi]|uniref:Uncharacterized protein n=1 Tax=Escovopsis weberi TaxID=150374 RepID=A0A0M9VXN9_ESCWE|nr:hypothetical protein ESCO_003831 [Escovopsis weberi]
MDGSNEGGGGGGGGGGEGPRDMSRAAYIRNARAVLEERNQRFLSRRHEFEPQVHDQINRLFQDYQAPLYARLRGFGRAQTLSLAESTVLSLVAVNGRRLEDAEAQALTEHFLSSVHSLLAWKWVMTGAAAYMAFRGRRAFRFPFFTPQFAQPRYSPVAAAAGPGLRAAWHTMRFGAYYVALWVLAEPVFQGANFMRQRAAMERDPRLRALLHEGKAQGATLLSGSPETTGQIGRVRETWDAAAREEAAQQGQGRSQDRNRDQDRDRDQDQDSTASWAPMPPPPMAQFPHQPSPSLWDSTDDFDDASPVAPPPNQPGGKAGGSAWDRIRQQSQYQPSQQRRGQQSWERPQSGGSWSNDVDSGRSRGSSSSESYSFSEDRGSSKETAQRDFDRLLDKERSGSDQDRNSWSRR